MQNLRLFNGRVPVAINNPDHPIVLVDFPTREDFDLLYGRRVSADHLDRYWHMLKSRAEGKTLIEAGKPYGLTRERVRQIEAKFLRLMTRTYAKK